MNLLTPNSTVSDSALSKARRDIALFKPAVPQIEEVKAEETENYESKQNFQFVTKSECHLPVQSRKRRGASSHRGEKSSGIKINTDENQTQEIEANERNDGEADGVHDSRRRTRRRSTVIDVMTMLGANQQNERRVSDLLLSRRRSTRANSFLETSRRFSMANKFKKKARKAPRCIFEVGKHTVKEVIEKIKEEIERVPMSRATDLLELINLLQTLSDSTFKEREQFEEEYIRFHIAQKKMKDFPLHFQDEVDNMALGIRQENVTLIEQLKTQRKMIDEELGRFETEGKHIESSNTLLFDQKDLSDQLVETLVGGLNQRMSLKAQTQIQVNKTMEEIGTVIKQTEGLPEQLEMLSINIGGEIEEMKFSIREMLIESEKIGILIVETGDQNVGIKRESDLLQERVKEKDRVIKQGNIVQEERLKRIVKESDAHSRLADEKRLVHSNKKRERDIARNTKERTETNDDQNIEMWEEKIAELQWRISQTGSELKKGMMDMYTCHGKEKEVKLTIVGLEGDLKFFNGSLETTNENLLKERNSVDELMDEKMFRNEKLRKTLEDAKVAKQLLDDELERATKRCVIQKDARKHVVGAWVNCDHAISQLKKKLIAYKNEQRKITSKLEQKSQSITDVLTEKCNQLEQHKDRTEKTHQKFKIDKARFEQEEINMHQSVKNAKMTLESNIGTVEKLKEILKKRQPIYEDHQDDADNNENLYESIKFKLAQTRSRENDIKATIKRTISSTETLQQKFKQKKSDKDLALDNTKEIINTNSKITNELDRKNYELLVEREQYARENQRIEKFKLTTSDHIDTMSKCDRKISVQLVEYSNRLKSLQSELGQYRNVYIDFCNQSDRDGGNILNSISNFEDETKRRYNVINFIQTRLNALAEHFESYVNNSDVEQKQPKKSQPKSSRKKRRFRVDVPLDVGLLHQVSELGKGNLFNK